MKEPLPSEACYAQLVAGAHYRENNTLRRHHAPVGRGGVRNLGGFRMRTYSKYVAYDIPDAIP